MKNALVTGATKGIGLAVARMLMEQGYFVTVTYAHDEEAAQKCKTALDGIGSHYELLRIDQSSKADCKLLARHMAGKGHVDCLVFNAGATLRKGITDFSDEEWESVMQVNVNAPVFLVRDLYSCIPHGSRIIFIGSEMAIYPHGTSLAYGVTKSAVHALARNLVKFFENTGTTVNAIAPGFVETEWQKTKPQEIRNNIYGKTAIRRFATVGEIADAVRFCVGNGFVNGSVIEVSGGYCYK